MILVEFTLSHEQQERRMSFTKFKEVTCNCGHLNIYQLSSSSSKYWLSMRELIQVIIHHQQENVTRREEDGEVMVSLGVALYLLFKVEIEDFSITSTINDLKQLVKNTPPFSPTKESNLTQMPPLSPLAPTNTFSTTLTSSTISLTTTPPPTTLPHD
jgi:hypothetical protein